VTLNAQNRPKFGRGRPFPPLLSAGGVKGGRQRAASHSSGLAHEGMRF
jgi:hypothetical protein